MDRLKKKTANLNSTTVTDFKYPENPFGKVWFDLAMKVPEWYGARLRGEIFILGEDEFVTLKDEKS